MGAGFSTDVASNIESSTRKDLIHQARSLHIDLRTRVRDALDEADQKKASTSVQNPLNNASKPVSKMSLQELKGLGPGALRDELKARGLPCDGDTVTLARRVMDAHMKKKNADTREKLQNRRSAPGKPASRAKAPTGSGSKPAIPNKIPGASAPVEASGPPPSTAAPPPPPAPAVSFAQYMSAAARPAPKDEWDDMFGHSDDSF